MQLCLCGQTWAQLHVQMKPVGDGRGVMQHHSKHDSKRMASSGVVSCTHCGLTYTDAALQRQCMYSCQGAFGGLGLIA